jgi:hypothetical protein
MSLKANQEELCCVELFCKKEKKFLICLSSISSRNCMHGHEANVAVSVTGEHCDCFDILLMICKALFLFIF